ncbi:hypothetical protein KAI87_17725, partial [Myxococcota bacterium]|nr:hypothetical protein [Myxococcota bacterium]
ADIRWVVSRSMVRLQSGELYIGAKHFLLKVKPSANTWDSTWLVPENEYPSDCFSRKKTNPLPSK